MAEEPDFVAEVANLAKLECNRVCCDCDAEGPDWASLNLGILLCINCAGVHRNLGVHISKVRSLHLDTDCWDLNQLAFMRLVGNVRARETYEAYAPCWYLRPSAAQPSALVRENWIRAKYERREFTSDVKVSPAISTMPSVPKEGFLWKANKKGVWQKRYVMLHGRFLYYFKNQSDSYYKGIIDVCELSFKLPNGSDQNKRYVFEAHTSKRVYPFGADTVADMVDWVHALKRAAAYYITISQGDTNFALPSEQDVVKLSLQQMGEPLQAGLLSKQGGKWKSWNKRYCVVTENTLFYFKKEAPQPADLPEGGIPLDQCFVMNGDSKADKKFCLCLATPARIFFLCASSEEERLRWETSLMGATDKLSPAISVDFSQMAQPEPIRSQLDNLADDSD